MGARREFGKSGIFFLLILVACSPKPKPEMENLFTGEITYDDTVVIFGKPIPDSSALSFVHNRKILKVDIDSLKKVFISAQNGYLMSDLLSHITRGDNRSIILKDSILASGYGLLFHLIKRGNFELWDENIQIDTVRLRREWITNNRALSTTGIVGRAVGYSIKNMRNKRLFFYGTDFWIE